MKWPVPYCVYDCVSTYVCIHVYTVCVYVDMSTCVPLFPFSSFPSDLSGLYSQVGDRSLVHVLSVLW